jgi:cell division protein FtsQ
LISFAEETPIARWGDNAFLNRSGLVLTAANSTGLDALLQLAGPPGSEREVMREYSDLARWLQPTGLKISTLSLDNRGSWSAQFEGGLRLLLGREQISARVHRFLVVWDLVLRERGAEVAQVDARYDGGLAVQWQKINEAG